MPGTLEAPAPATDVSTIAPSSAVQNRDARNSPRRETSPDRNRAGRDKLNAVARDMAAKKFQTGAQPIQDVPASTTPSPEVSTTPAAEATKAPVAAKETPAPKTLTAEEKAAAAEKSKKVGAAKRALALDGWEPDDIAALKEDKLLAIGAHRAKNQADVNREFDRLKKSATSPTGVRNDDGTFAPKPETKAEPEAKPESAAKPVVDAAPAGDVDEVLTKEEEAEIGELGARLFKRQAATHKAEMAKIRAELKGQGEVGNALTMETVYSHGRELVESEYPDQLKDPAAFDEVTENFNALVASGRYGRGQISKAWRDAGHMAFGAPDSVQKAQREMLARQNAADIGQVDLGRGDTTTTTEPAKISKPRDALRAAAKMFAANPNGNLEDMRTKLMSKVKVSGR